MHRLPPRRRAAHHYPDRSELLARVEPVYGRSRAGEPISRRCASRSSCPSRPRPSSPGREQVGVPVNRRRGRRTRRLPDVVARADMVLSDGGVTTMIPRYTTPEMAAVFPTSRGSPAGSRSSCSPPRPTRRRPRPGRRAAACPSARRSSTTTFVRRSSLGRRSPITTWPRSSTSCRRAIGTPEASWIHYGLTSSDVVDTALCWMLRDAADLLVDASDELLDARRLAHATATR